MADQNGAGGDGMGGDGVALEPRDGDILPDNAYADGPEFEMDPEFVVQAPPEEGGTEADPLAALGDEGRQLAEAKGWKDPADVARAYRELESKLGSRESDQVSALQRELAELKGMMSAPRAPDPQQYGFRPEKDAIDQVFEDVDFNAIVEAASGDPAVALHIYQEQAFLPRFKHILSGMAQEIMEANGQQIGQRTAPLEQGMTRVALRDQAQGLMSKFPDDFPRLRDQVQQRMTSDPNLLRASDGMQRAFYEVFAEDQSRKAQQARMAGEGESLGRGGGASPGRAAPMDPAKEIKAAIEGAMRSPMDGL